MVVEPPSKAPTIHFLAMPFPFALADALLKQSISSGANPIGAHVLVSFTLNRESRRKVWNIFSKLHTLFTGLGHLQSPLTPDTPYQEWEWEWG